jgi:hypothetical protein
MAPLGLLPVVAVAQLALMGSVAWAWLLIAGASPGAFEAVVCAAPALLAFGLGFTSQDDRQQYVVRLVACAAMLPILLMMWAGSQDTPAATTAAHVLARRPWIFFTAFALLHAATFLAAIAWLASTVTRVEAAPGATPVPAALLVQRLQSLAAAGVPIDVAAAAAPGEWAVALRLADAERTHRVLLQIDERTHTVRVRERLGASGAAPRDADEASMRGIGDAAVDPTRPDAQRVSSRVAQASMIDPARLQAMRLVLRNGHAEPAPPAITRTAADPDELVVLLCALVTRSGYAWQPLLGLGRAR